MTVLGSIGGMVGAGEVLGVALGFVFAFEFATEFAKLETTCASEGLLLGLRLHADKAKEAATQNNTLILFT